MATIEKRNQGSTTRYRVRWWAGDKQRSKTFTAFQDARRFKALLEGDLANGTYRDPRDAQVTVAVFAQRWWPTVVDLRPSTHDRVELALKHVLREFGSLPLAGVTHSHVAQWVAAQTKDMSAASVRKNAFTFRRMLDAAVHEGLLKSNPVTHVRLPAVVHHEQRFLNKMEIDSLITAAPDRYKAMVLLAIYGGFRFGELCGLQRSSINPASSTVRVSKTLVDLNGSVTLGPPKTKTSVRTVTVPRSVMQALVQHMDSYTDGAPDSIIFTGPTGPIRRCWFRGRVWLPTIKSAGLEGLRFHDLRHTFVALWVDLGRNAKEVSRVAGHSSVAFTLDRYGHLYEVDESSLADDLDKLLA